MADQFDAETRNRIMRAVSSADTYPERWVGEVLYGAGAEFEPQAADLPGTPDFALPDRGVAVFVHGCFWHRHDCPDGRQVPETNVDYWREKFERNVDRDREAVEALEAEGWEVVVVWECEIHGDPEGARDELLKCVFGETTPLESLAQTIVSHEDHDDEGHP